MKTQMRIIEAMLKIFGDTAFYTISMSRFGSTSFQGNFKSELVATAQRYRFTPTFLENGFVDLRRGNITITLT